MNLETMQREGQEKVYKDIIYWVMNPSAREAIFTPKEANDVIDQHTADTWKAAQESIKKSILESGLLEEVIPVGDEMVDNPEKERVNREIAGNNTLARAVKELISKMNSV